jgi:hypothetical protein
MEAKPKPETVLDLVAGKFKGVPEAFRKNPVVEKTDPVKDAAGTVKQPPASGEGQTGEKVVNETKQPVAGTEGQTGELKVGDGKAKPVSFKAISVDHGVIIGVGSVADIYDKEDELVEKGALIGMAFDFCAREKRVFKANHTDEIECELVSSWPGGAIKATDAEGKETIIGIDIRKGVESHWFVGVRPKDPAILEEARKGNLAGFSWSGGADKKSA